jgi:RHS repeat-associated protein
MTASYDAANHIVQFNSTAYSYDANGNLLTDGQRNYTWDPANRLTQISGSSIASFQYDPYNRRTSKTINGSQTGYLYDGINPVQELAGSTPRETTGTGLAFSMSKANLPQDMTASYDAANHISQFNSTAYSYDANGNLLTDGQRNYTWDPANRLTQISGSSIASFQYDPYNRRTSKTINGNQTGYLYDGINPVQELTGSTPIANLLSGGVDEHFARTTASKSDNYLTDALGSTLALTDTTGAVNTQYSYEAYGNTTQSGTTSDNAYQYTGRENDGTGLYYYRARYYDTQTSRFISQDPIGFGGGVNQFAYVGGIRLAWWIRWD